MPALPSLGLGCAALGVDRGEGDDAVIAMLEGALARGITYFDTSPLYGSGRSETLLGHVLKGADGSVKVSTKVGYRTTAPYGTNPPPSRREQDFSAAFVRDSIECSLERLGRSSLDLVLLHDPDDRLDAAVDQAWPALVELRNEGVVGAIGVGTNAISAAIASLERARLDAILVAGRYTLLDRSAMAEVLPATRRQGVQAILAGVFNSGLLAGPGAPFTFDYAPPSPDVRKRLRGLRAACREYGVPLKAAAVQFVRRNAFGATMLIGPRTLAELDEILGLLDRPIPAAFWMNLDAPVAGSDS